MALTGDFWAWSRAGLVPVARGSVGSSRPSCYGECRFRGEWEDKGSDDWIQFHYDRHSSLLICVCVFFYFIDEFSLINDAI